MNNKKTPVTFFTYQEKKEAITTQAKKIGISRSAYINSMLYIGEDD